MVDRDLTLAVRTTGTPAAKAELDSLKTSVDGLSTENAELAASVGSAAAAETALGGAARAATTQITAQGVETQKVEGILAFKARIAQEASAREAAAVLELVAATRAANTAMRDLGDATVIGGQKMVPALLAARNAVAALEVEQAKLRAAGGIVPPGNLALLASYDNQVAKLTATTEVATAATAKATGGLGRYRGVTEQATGSTRILGAATAQAGQALAGHTANLGSLTAGFLRFLGPIGLATAAITLLPSLVRGLKDAFKTLSDIIDGSVSKALADMRGGFEKAQEKLEGLDTATRNYRDAADLMAAGGLNAKTVIDGLGDSFEGGANSAANFGGAIVFAGDGFVSLSGGAATAKSAIDGLSNTINEVRLTAPEAARSATEAFLELSRSFAAGKITAGEFFEQVRGLREGLLPLAKVSEEVGTAIKEKFGNKFEETQAQFGAFSAAVPSIIARLEELKAGGLSSGQAFEVLKSEILTAAKNSETFAGIIDLLPAQMQAWIAQLKEAAKGHDAISVAIDNVRAKTLESVNAFNAIYAALAKGTEQLGSRAAAIASLSTEIEKLVSDIEKQRDSEGELSVSNQVMLDELVKLQAEAAALGPAVGGLTNRVQALHGAMEQTATQTFDFATGLEIVGASANGQASALETLIESLKALGLEYDRVKEKGEAAFGGGEGVPSFGTSGTVGAYSSINASGSNLAPGGGGTSTGPTPPPFRYP